MKRGLQIVLAILSLIPLVFGVLGLKNGGARYIGEGQLTPMLDSFVRFQSGIYLVIFMLIWWLIPNVEKHTAVFRISIFAVFLGGIGRVISYYTIGPPPPMMFWAMFLELGVPVLILWQAKLTSSTK